MHKTLSSVSLHQCWVTTGLYGVQNLIGATARTEGCLQLGLQTSTRAEGMQRALGIDALHQPVLSYNKAVWGAKPHKCNCRDRRLSSAWFADQH